MVKSKVWIISKQCYGMPQIEDFQCVEEQLPPCKDGDVIIEAEYWSVDPYMRIKIRSLKDGSCPPGAQVARVIQSRNQDYPVGSYIVGYPGWRTHTHLTSKEIEAGNNGAFALDNVRKLFDLGAIRRSAALGAMGMPGNTAYFAFGEYAKPKSGETVLINGAAGAVGNVLVQIAKINGCKVIAFAGSDEKVSWLRELGADHAYNYKSTNISETIKEVAPNGIDCYFDHVGGKFTREVIPHMAKYGRVTIIGLISVYNDEQEGLSATEPEPSPYIGRDFLMKELRVEGMIVSTFEHRWNEGLTQLKRWIEEGKIQYRETITNGFENLPLAFAGLFKGENIGKAIIQA